MAWSFGKCVKIARIERGMSQQELARAAGMRQSHLSMVENARHAPSVSVMRHLTHALGVNAEYLLGLGAALRPVTYPPLEPEEAPCHACQAATRALTGASVGG